MIFSYENNILFFTQYLSKDGFLAIISKGHGPHGDNLEIEYNMYMLYRIYRTQVL